MKISGCVYQFTGEMLIFNNSFRLIERMKLESPEIRDYRDNYYQEDREGLANPDRNIALFFTFQIFNDKLFLGGQKFLHCVNKETGKVEHLVQFSIKADDENHLSGLPFFGILDDGVFVGNNSYYGGELFSAPLPQQIFDQLSEAR